jgi:Zn-dependent M28 family amino/carboxypeptidase
VTDSGQAPISAERIAKHVFYLASDKLQGRRAGTTGADLAAGYIAEQFKSFKLRPPPAKGYRVPFTFVASVQLGPANSFQAESGHWSSRLAVGEDFMPLAFSSDVQASGPVLFLAYGISAPELQYDNYAGIDVRGKLVMLMRGSPDGDNPHGRFADYAAPGLEIQRKTTQAREKGAAGLIFISDEERFSEDRFSRLRHDLNFLDAGIPAVTISRQAAQSILTGAGASLAELEKAARTSPSPTPLKGVSVRFKTDVVKVKGEGSNVIGILPGSDPALASQYVIIGAHYDHLGLGGPDSLAAMPEGQIHHGADDNASGTAAMLELARVMSKSGKAPKRSLIFIAFSGEEMGLLGSAAYTKNPVAPLASTVAMLNMDMVGRLRERLLVSGVGTSPAWQPLLERLKTVVGDSSGRPIQLEFGQDGFGPSDHQSFYVRNMPVLFFFTGNHDDYHKPSDTAEKINTEGVRRIAELVRQVAVSIADEPERIAFTRVQTANRPSGRGFSVYLGTVPNYSDQTGGLKLDGVRPDSPAERAGLTAGDIITKLGSVTIKNVYDYTYALGELKPGLEVEVVLLRDGRELKLKIIPDKRR